MEVIAGAWGSGVMASYHEVLLNCRERPKIANFWPILESSETRVLAEGSGNLQCSGDAEFIKLSIGKCK